METVITVVIVIVAVGFGLFAVGLGLAHFGLMVVGGPAWLVWRTRTIWRVYTSAKSGYDDDGIKRDHVHSPDWSGYVYRGPYGEPLFPVDPRTGWFGNTVKVCVRKPSPEGPAAFCDRNGHNLKRVPKRVRESGPEERWRSASRDFPESQLGLKWPGSATDDADA